MKTPLLLLLLIASVQAQPIPAGVSAKKIRAEWVQPGVSYKDLAGDNKVLDPGELTNVQVRFSKLLEFTNVGALGGPELAKAVLINRYTALDGGEIYQSKGRDGWPIKPGELPTFPDEVVPLVFSGGPQGHFRYASGRPFDGWIDLKSNTVHLEIPGVNAWELSITSENAFKDWLDMTSNFDPSKSTSNFDTPQTPQVRFSSLTGEVELRPDDGSRPWHFVKLNSPINRLDHIRTGEESQAIVGFPDLSTCVIGPESEVIITYDPARKDSKIDLVCGNIWRNIKKMVKDGTMEVEMTQGAATIKGTTLVCQQDQSGSTLKVLEGSVDFRSKVKPGQHMLLKPGQQVTADSQGLGPVQKFPIQAESKRWAYASYQHPEGKLRFQYPAPWSLNSNFEGHGMDVLSLPKDPLKTLQIKRQSWPVTQKLTLATARAAVQAERPQAKAFELEVAGSACWVLVEELDGEIPVTLWHLLLAKNERVYYLVVSSPKVQDNRQLPSAFSGIVESLHFTR